MNSHLLREIISIILETGKTKKESAFPPLKYLERTEYKKVYDQDYYPP